MQTIGGKNYKIFQKQKNNFKNYGKYRHRKKMVQKNQRNIVKVENKGKKTMEIITETKFV